MVAAQYGTLRWGRSPPENKRKLELERLRTWMERCAMTSGAGWVIQFLKGAAAEVRWTVITGSPLGPGGKFITRRTCMWGREPMEQLSFLGRALPEGDRRVELKSLRTHKRCVTTSVTTAPLLLAKATAWASRCMGPRLRGWKADLSVSPSATVANSRRSGGCREEIRSRRADVLASIGVPDRSAEVPYGTFLPDMFVDALRFNNGAEQLAEAMGHLTASNILEHRVCSIAERGWKRRIVTSPPSYALSAGTTLNKWLLAPLLRERRTRLFLLGKRREAVEAAMTFHKEGHLIVSTDLKAASDMLPLDLVQSVAEGLLLRRPGLPTVWVEALRSLIGRQVLHYPDGSTAILKRGILMGLGPTWPLLSMIHLFWVDLAAERVGTVGARVAARHGTAIGGDDLIATWPPELVRAYEAVVAECHGEFSVGKYFLSRTAGNFTEMSFYVVPRRAVRGRPPIRWARGIPVRGLVDSSVDKTGQAYESMTSDCGRALRARRVIRALKPGVWSAVRKDGVPPCMPRSLAGAGLPPVRGSVMRVSAPFRLRLALGRFLYGSGQDQVPLGPPSWTEARDRVSLLARERAESVLWRETDEGSVLKFSTNPDPRPGRARRVSDWLQNETSLFSQAALFTDEPLAPCAARVTPPTLFASACAKWIRRKVSGGVPKGLALSNNVKTREKLLRRARLNRDRWFANLQVDPQFYYGG